MYIIRHILFYFFNLILFFNFTILYWFCHISKWIHHRYTCDDRHILKDCEDSFSTKLQYFLAHWFPWYSSRMIFDKKPWHFGERFWFIDYAKAFDSVDHNKLWKILQEIGIPAHLTCLLRNLYAGQEATVKTGHGTTD